MIATLECVVLDCPEPKELAEFYAGIIGGKVSWEDDDDSWVTLSAQGGTVLAFQKAPELQRAKWPDPERPQQFHLDLQVDDLEAAQAHVLGLGAELLDDKSSKTFRVYEDPAGHPFCLCVS
ncbi:VOC family protein [Wenjunlia tyrosinilytica]|uniref:Glyoxalase n=1 Tax=Wenjunlia tyrosinilytica TaxID=1544741 RepID=A0A918DYH5_9ACTN|nr:VOC family protein [Wenjunlia tyrosinilytica]GGO88145.1 glyoxalase [Wenjunlia tyrosinilytica]